MTLDDLRKTFNAGWEKSVGYGSTDPELEGLKAVVAALWRETADKGHYEIHMMFEEIVGGSNDAG